MPTTLFFKFLLGRKCLLNVRSTETLFTYMLPSFHFVKDPHLFFFFDNLFVLHPNFGHCYSERKKIENWFKWNHRQPKKQQICCTRKCTKPIRSNHCNFTRYSISTERALNPKPTGISISSVFVSYTAAHNNEDVYHHQERQLGVQVSLEKKGTGEPQANRVVIMLPHCPVRWETTIASAQISQR